MAPRGGACHHFPPGTGVWEDTTGCWFIRRRPVLKDPFVTVGACWYLRWVARGRVRRAAGVMRLVAGRCLDLPGGGEGRGGGLGWARPGYLVWSWVAVTPVMAILSRLVTAQAKDSSAWTAVRPRRAKRRSPRRSLSQALGASLMGARRL